MSVDKAMPLLISQHDEEGGMSRGAIFLSGFRVSFYELRFCK